MRELLLLAAVVTGGSTSASAQRSAEQEVRTFLAAYDSAVMQRDTAFLARALSAEYVLTGASGRKSEREQVLRFYARERAAPSYRRISLQHDNVIIRVVGRMALVTNDYTARTSPVDAPNDEPEVTRGRHTGVFEKRDGRWVVLAEQDTEQPHDDSTMVRQVTNAGRQFYELTQRLSSGRDSASLEQRGDLAVFARLLADDFICTCGNGGTTGKAQELARVMDGRRKLESVRLLQHAVVAIDNNSAVETGEVRIVGQDEDLRIDVLLRFTKTWVSWGHGWQIIAQHLSVARE